MIKMKYLSKNIYEEIQYIRREKGGDLINIFYE